MSGIGSRTYDAIQALEYRYARLLDDDRLEEWPDLFVERGVYKVIPRENLDRQPALPIMFCDSRAMMVDRVVSLRKANIYNLHYSRNVVSNIEILSARDDAFEVAACYTVYQTDLEGQTRLFSVGQYRDVIANGYGGLKFREKVAVCDTFNIPNLLAIPLCIGYGIDDHIFLVHRHEATPAAERDPALVLTTTGRAIVLTTLATVAGFAGLMPAHFVGLRLLGLSGALAAMNHGSTAMQWPPTPGPGWRIFTRGWRLAMRITSHTLMPARSQTIESSLAKAMLTSRKLFSESLTISAVRESVPTTSPRTKPW